jgi:hypothetical protein
VSGFFEFMALAAGFAALTWFSIRTGVDQQVSRDRSPRMFKMMVGLNVVFIAMCVGAAIATLFSHSR